MDRDVGQSKATLPFARRDLDLDDAIIVHVKVLSLDLREVAEVTRAVTQQLRGLRVGDRPVALFVSAENVEMTVTNIRNIAALVTPSVLQAVGMSQ